MDSYTHMKTISRKRQTGIALITGLILMVVLTILALAAMRSTTLEERMSGNTRDRDMAFQAAEAALRVGEAELRGAVPPALVSGTARTPRIVSGSQTEYWINTHPWASQSQALNWTPAGTWGAPSYVIELMSTISGTGGGGLGLGPIPDQGMYRVTARGIGRNANTVVILQAIYQR